jgi:predicted methyltransferase
MTLIVLSHFQTEELLAAWQAGRTHAEVSPDLGLTTVEVLLDADGACFTGGERVGWDTIRLIAESPNDCVAVGDGEARKIQIFSEAANRLYTLMPTSGAPTMLISGIPMHRIKGTDPHRDTLVKLKTIRPITGQVLDTATGLGYTAIEAAKTADRVVTVEVEPVVLELARMNPWSRGLFGNPKIEQRIGDSDDVIREFGDDTFSRIIHDPPAFSLAGHLYGREFYRELYRVLRRGGQMFHYIGNPESKSGHSITSGVMRRLQEVGFTRVARKPEAFGVVAFK